MTVTKCGGWARAVKGKPHLRIISIPMPNDGMRVSFMAPAGCRILSHSTYMSKGMGMVAQIVVDISNEKLSNEPEMPPEWDYRNYLRDGHTPVRRRAARR